MTDLQTPPPSQPLVGAVRANHRLDEAKLAAWLKANVDPFDGPLVVEQFQRGASNPTFLLTAGGRRYVMRKKPPGQLLASAHQVDREYRVMKALGSVGFPVPVMRALCEDDSIVGTPFYVMDFLEGRIFRDATLPGVDPAERRAIYDNLGETLARLHEVDYEAIGLGDYGRPGHYFERAIGRWTKQYRGAETTPVPEMEKLIEALPRRMPKDNTITIAHGDYRPENVMYHPTEPRIIAVLDWELSTLGHPLADVGYVSILWHSHSQGWGSLLGVDYEATGLPTEEQFLASYVKRTGREIDDFPFYLAFSLFRLASISQGVFKRNLDGIGNAPASGDNSGTRELAKTAWDVLNR